LLTKQFLSAEDAARLPAPAPLRRRREWSPQVRSVFAHVFERIGRMRDPAERNRDITRAYSDLSQAMAKLFGPGHASWPSFASWASQQAGKPPGGHGTSLMGAVARAAMRTALKFP